MGIPTLELRPRGGPGVGPGVGLGPFLLGSPICDALAEVEKQQSLFESTVIKYSEQDPLCWDIVVAFPHLGFHLCFDPRHQRLHKLEVYDLTRVHLRYANSFIGGPSTPATFSRIYSMLGPTFPGSYKQEAGTYTLCYPGLSLLFRIPPRYASCCLQRKELPLEFPDGTTPVVSRISLHLGDALQQHREGFSKGGGGASGQGTGSVAAAGPSVHMPSLPLPLGGMYMEEVHVRLGESIFFTAGQQEICFGFSPQDVWSELGRPCSIVQREVETMLIHLATVRQGPQHHQHQHPHAHGQQHLAGDQLKQDLKGQPGQSPAAHGDFTWSYFTRGIDIVFDAETRTVKKFVLHTNAPGHPDFNEYVKCNFIIFPNAQGGSSSPDSLSSAKIQAESVVTANSKWKEVQRILGGGGRAAIQTSGSLHIAFGPTFVYGLRGATFEVMRNGHISTVTLFQADNC